MRGNLRTLTCSALSLPLLAALLLAQTPPSAGTHDGQLQADFEARVKKYLDFRGKAAGGAPKPSDNPATIIQKQRELGDKVRVARAGAKQGELFTPEIAQYFRKQIGASLAGPHGKEIRSSLKHAEPVKMELQINQSYPPNVPLQSTPPTLLLNLPALPDGLEFRLLDRELALRDTEANIVVDYVPNALPESIQ
jgi:hypothetical protein